MICRGCGSSNCKVLGCFQNFPSSAQAFYESRASGQLDASQSFDLIQCESCALVQIDCYPVSYYKSVITAASIGAASEKKLYEEWAPILAAFELNGGSALEVGAGRGDFVKILRKWGLSAVGLESKPVGDSDSLMIDGYFPEIQLDQTFNLIVCNNFLEHHPTPKKFLESIYNHLNANGIFYVSVPRFEYLYERGCFYELIPDHLSYFTQSSLQNILQNSGFEVLKQYTKNNHNDHVAICKKRTLLSLDQKLIDFEEIVNSLRLFLCDYDAPKPPVTVWGAGHRTLSLLSMVNSSRIKQIIDSAPFKQGKYAPITGLPVISPDEFLDSPTDILLLMLPGSYAEQVLNFLSRCSVVPKTYLFDDTKDIKQVN